MKELELRMYSLVMYNISPIQQGIQAYHATQEALNHFSNSNSIDRTDYTDWNEKWKTVIILNGGSSVTMEQHFNTLWENQVGCSFFREPDLNDSMSAISFIVDERVFNRELYPDFVTNQAKIDFYQNMIDYHKAILHIDPIRKENEILFFTDLIDNLQRKDTVNYLKWCESIGGAKQVFLRSWLKNFRLA